MVRPAGIWATTARDRLPFRAVRAVLRAPGAAPVGAPRRAPRLRGGARASRARRFPRLRLLLAGRAPLPGGVQPLERARGLPRRPLAAHTPHPTGARHRADAATDQPPGARGRAPLHARPPLW